MNTWLAWMATYALTGNPLVALAVAVVIAYSGESWWRGRLWRPWAFFQRWMRVRELYTTIDANPHDATARAELGRLLVERSRYAEALPQLEKAHERAPTVAGTTWLLGAAKLALGDLEAGRELVEKAISIRKDIGYGEPLCRLGDAYAAKGRWADAIDAYERARRIHTSSAEFAYKCGAARLASGDKTGAKADFDEAIQIWRGSPGFKAPRERSWALRSWWARRSV